MGKSKKLNTRSIGVVVLGMHRSGTSLVAGLLAHLGLDAGGELLATETQNPKGFWEHAGCVVAHEQFLQEAGRHWADPRPISGELFEGSQAYKAKDKLRSIYQEDFSPKRYWFVKDPRICRLLPLWEDIISDVGSDIRFLHVIRHPDSVASSLKNRDDMSRDHSMMLWLRHNIESELFTRNSLRCFVTLDDLLSSPVECISTINRRLRLGRIIRTSNIKDTVQGFLDASLIHHKTLKDKDSTLNSYPIVQEAMKGLQNLANGNEEFGQSNLNSVAAGLTQMDRLAGRTISQHLAESLLIARRSEQGSQARTYDLTADNARLESAVEQISLHRDQLVANRDEVAEQLLAEKNKMSILEGKLLDVERENTERKNRIDRVETVNSTFREEIQGHKKAYAALKEQLETANSTFRDEIQGHKEAYATLKEQLETANSTFRGEIQGHKEAYVALKEQLETANSTFRDEIQGHKEAYAALKEQLETANSILRGEGKRHKDACAKIEDQLGTERREHVALADQVQQLVRTVTESGKHVRALEIANANDRRIQQAKINALVEKLDTERHSAAQLLATAKGEVRDLAEARYQERCGFENSLSWRITWPLRQVRLFFSTKRTTD